MKKLGILSVLILCVVIGGVYATWDYAQGDVGAQNSSVAINLTAVNTEGSKGNIGSRGPSSLNLYIDDTDGDHMANVVTGEGELNIIFNPSSIADPEVKKNGVILEYTLSTSYQLTDFVYKGKQVFTSIDTTPQVLNGGNPTKDVVIKGSDIAKLITINPLFALDSYADYNDFYKNVLPKHAITLTISEKVVVPEVTN